MTQNSKRKMKELISVAFQLRMSKVLKYAQIETNSKVKLQEHVASNLRLAYSQQLSARQQDEEEIDDKAKARKDKGT